MPTHIGIGFSATSDPVEAFKLAALEAKSYFNAVRTELVLVFATASYASSEGLRELREILHPAQLIGSVTPGIILKDRTELRGVGVMAVVSDELHFSTACQPSLAQTPVREAGYRLAHALVQGLPSGQRSAGLYFYDGLRRNGTLFCLGVREALGSALPITGAVGGDTSRSAARHFFQTNMIDDAAVGLLVSGANTVCLSARHSWQPLGKPRIIDTSEDNIIRTINKRPAAELYRDYFPSDSKYTVTQSSPDRIDEIRLLYPLGLSTARHREYLIRIPIDILEDGSIVCQGDVPTGSSVHLMITDKDACRQTMHDTAVDIRDQLGGKHPKFILAFESFTRRKVLGRHAAQGAHAVREILGSTVPFFGMHTLSEVAPLAPVAQKNIAASQVLNGSVVLLAIG